jgi:hypothetical protein
MAGLGAGQGHSIGAAWRARIRGRKVVPGPNGDAAMKHTGGCHCGGIAFALDADITEAMDCNCSLCRKRGGLLAFFPREALVLKTPESGLGTYTFK